jgi:predicted short-subunit dehydrogenase-like oxidoreductase (DUF2520 family)
MTEDTTTAHKVAVIGTGRVGTAMAHLLSGKGYDVAAVCDLSLEAREKAAALSGARAFEDAGAAAGLADVIIFTTTDDAIESTCNRLATAPAGSDPGGALSGKKVVHMSGALGLDPLSAASRAGADVLAIHPIQTFADIEGAERSLPGSTFGVTCEPGLEDWARGFVATLGGRVIIVKDADKVLYHAAAAVACNLLAMVEYGAQVIMRGLGFPDEETSEAFAHLSAATVENVARLGPAAALTGPLARGDVGTLRSHMEALRASAPDLAEMYRAVSLWGLRLVAEKGELSAGKIDEMRNVLED